MLDELLEPCFRLIMLVDKLTKQEIGAIGQQAASYGVPFVLVHSEKLPQLESDPDCIHVLEANGLIAKWLQNKSIVGAIVRPDHYVYSGITQASDAMKYIDLLISYFK